MSSAWWEWTLDPRALACGATFVCAWLLARLAPRLGWVDCADGGRKQQREPLPLVGGASLAVGLGFAAALGAAEWGWGDLRSLPEWPQSLSSPWSLAALAVAFVVGWIDDVLPGGLRPAAKLVGQALCGSLAAGPLIAAGAWLPAVFVIGAALVALNALNTFDNADGAAAGISVLALAGPLPVAACAMLGFLPFNLRRADERALFGRLPRAILGDSGSHLLGMLILLTPVAWPALTLPLLDLARVAIERMRNGQAPWVGDRRHLAHRLQARGLSPAAVALALALIAFPSVGLGAILESSPGVETALGSALTALLFSAATLLSAPRGRPSDAESAELGLEA
jgi:UDP-GlcNAc:undecaprenyl-phosphate/decaprenyl-phosphate GlcNAc-1-phosphate transferase